MLKTPVSQGTLENSGSATWRGPKLEGGLTHYVFMWFPGAKEKKAIKTWQQMNDKNRFLMIRFYVFLLLFGPW